ncbi:MarR family winged helix-turn-helix transcriptional regulator [Amycolatopsis cihanbeyliensis]|uniref:Transcriptional regulator n=1 Tax=Amycolatopsis cihanbeyliensis TaxID=1128664 RepID=A0A542DEP6_AMYCI|nr:MarR family winged helix-turn-helix transcriptional regulator [Amycolatopsis cihanbeyliensis]TQJ01547.1 transcriptional regulator [Amycolatopsis cihanbeyliensis]
MPEPAAPGSEASAPEWLTQSVAPKLHLTAKASRQFFEQLLAEQGASFAMWTVLATLTVKGPMIQRELAARLSIEGPTLTRHLESMVGRGLVSRTRTDTDRRSSLVELTEDGRRMYERLASVATGANEAMLSGVSPTDVQRFGQVLDRILANVARR